MKFKLLLLFVVLILTTNLTAQSNNLEVSLSPVAGTKADWNLDFSLNIGFAAGNGFALKVPNGVMLIPVSLRINETEVWLQKANTISDRDSTVAWRNIAEGLIFLYKDQLIKQGDRIQLECIANIINTPLQTNEVTVSQVVRQADGFIASDQVSASGLFPAIPNR
ncbi:MAG: hypothetical protein P8184_14400 [Calditrichia bacterium]